MWNVFDAKGKFICQMSGGENGEGLYDPRIDGDGIVIFQKIP